MKNSSSLSVARYPKTGAVQMLGNLHDLYELQECDHSAHALLAGVIVKNIWKIALLEINHSILPSDLLCTIGQNEK